MATKDGYYIGIDLGTAYTCTAIFLDEEARIVPHEGQSRMPSCVAFTETGRLVGAAAMRQAAQNPENTIVNALRFFGRKLPDTNLNSLRMPFRCEERDKNIVFVVQYMGAEIILKPEEILAMILSRAKQDAQSYLGNSHPVKGAVITVPACFNVRQRQSIKDAAAIADLSVFRMTNSPTTAALDYVITQPTTTESRHVLFVDIGAATVNVMLALVEEKLIEVKNVVHDDFLGGEMLSMQLLNDLVGKLGRTTTFDQSADPRGYSRALRRMLTAAETAKCELSTQQYSKVDIEGMYKGHDLSYTLTRKSFEATCTAFNLFEAILDPVDQALNDAKRKEVAIDSVVLLGGSSRTPMIQKRLSERLLGTEILKCLNPDEAPARGAAVLAAITSGSSSKILPEVLLMDVLPMTLGLEPIGGVMLRMIERNTLLPVKSRIESFTSSEDNQPGLIFSVFEGERALAKDNIALGKIEVPVAPAPVSGPTVEAWIHVGGDLSIVFSAVEKGSNKKSHFNIGDLNRMPAEELERLKVEAKKFDEVEQLERSRIEVRNAAERYIFGVKESIPHRTDALNRLLNEAMDWLDENENATAEEYHQRIADLHSTAQIIPADFLGAFKVSALKHSKWESSAEATTEHQTFAPSKLIEMATADKDMDGPRDSESHSSSDAGETGPTRSQPSENLANDNPKPTSDNIATRHVLQEELLDYGRPEESVLRSDLEVALDPISDGAVSPVPDRLTAVRSETPRSAERSMTDLFARPLAAQATYTDAEFIRISTYLRNTGRVSWSNVPRLYTVLRRIDQLDMLDTFIEQGLTDIWFPFAPTSLPNALSPTARANFVTAQGAVLSKSLAFEKNIDRKHAHFSKDDPLPFEVVAKLGSGAHGHVDKVMSIVSHREYARKVFRRARGLPKTAIRSFLVELQVLKRVQHFHCVELVQSYTDPKYFALIMSPVADCNLFEYYDLALRSPDKLSLLRSFFGCLANALQYIHSIKIRHRDIKPHNILVKGDRVLLTDFGIALDWENLSRSTTTADSGKTPIYAAPEVAQYEKRNSAADVWSLGCVFFEMVTVLKGQSITALRDFFQDRSGNYRFYANLKHLAEWVGRLRKLGSPGDNALFKMMRPMFDEDAEDRPTAATLFHDISTECAATHVPFCGSCCLEDFESSGVEDEDDELWGRAAELTIMPG